MLTQNELFIPVYLPILIWLFGLIVLFAILLKKFTFGKWTVANPNPYVSETLGMPTGIFRGLITLTLLYCVVVFEVANFVIGQKTSIWKSDDATFGQFLTAFQMMIAFYFGSKVVSQLSSSDEKKTEVKANAAATIQGLVSNAQTANSSSTFAPTVVPTPTAPTVEASSSVVSSVLTTSSSTSETTISSSAADESKPATEVSDEEAQG